jgi:hypothetical protein
VLRENLIWVVAGAIALAVIWLAGAQFSAESRLRRRRRKNNHPIITKSNRPTVKFSVKTPKE